MTVPVTTTTSPDTADPAQAVNESKAVRHLHHDIHDRPFIVIWEVTRACQLACKHCRAEAMPLPNPNQLTTAQGKELLDEIARFDKPRPIVVFTGGDPFEREDLPELTAYAGSLGLSVALSPSVTPLLTRDRLAVLRDAGAKAVSLSLDGARAQTHDAFRGISGTFEETLRAAATVKELGFRLQINTTVTTNTVYELPQVLARVLDMGAALWSVFFLVPTGRGEELVALSPGEIEDVHHWLVDMSHHIAIKTTEAPHFRRVVIERAAAEQQGITIPTGPMHGRLTELTAAALGDRPIQPRPARPPIDVNSGRGFAFVDHVGYVYPSGFLPHRAGNVTQQPFREIYREAPIMRALRDPAGFVGKCGVCEYNEVCGGSRSHAYAMTGDPLASDPTCAFVPAQLTDPEAELIESCGGERGPEVLNSAVRRLPG